MVVSQRDIKRSVALNRRVKGVAGWIVLAVVALAVLAVGATRDTGPQTQEDRVDAISKRVACPVCDGESVFESRNNASLAIRNETTDLVRESRLSDDQIVAVFVNKYGDDVLLVPRGSGFDVLVWMLPAIAFAGAAAGLAVVFRRWKRQAANTGKPTDADRALVEAALLAETPTEQ